MKKKKVIFTSVATCFLGVLLLAGFFRGPLLTFACQRYLFPKLHEALPGLVLNVQSVALVSLTSITLTNLTADYRFDDGGRLQATLPTVRSSLQPALLTKGWRPFVEQVKLELDHPSCAIFLVAARQAAGPGKVPALPVISVPLPEVILSDGLLQIRQGKATALLKGLAIQTASFAPHAENKLRAAVQLEEVQVGVGGQQQKFRQLAGEFLYGRQRLELTSLRCGNREVARRVTLAEVEPGRLKGEALITWFEQKLQISGAMADSELELAFNSEKFAPELMPLGVGQPVGSPKGNLRAQGNLKLSFAEQGLAIAGNLELAIDHGVIFDLPLDSARFAARADGTTLMIKQLALVNKDLNLQLSNCAISLQKIMEGTPADQLRHSRGELSLHASSLRPYFNVLPMAVTGFLDHFALDQLEVQGEFKQGGRLALTKARLAGAGNSISLRDVAYQLPADLLDAEAYYQSALQGLWAVALADASRLTFFEGSPSLSGPLEASGRYGGTLLAPVVDFKMVGKKGVIQGVAVQHYQARGTYREQLIHLESFTAEQGPDNLHLTGVYHLNKEELLKGHFTASVQDISRYLPPADQGGAMAVKGRVAAEGELAGPLAEVRAAFRATGQDLLVGGQRFSRFAVEAKIDKHNLEVTSFQAKHDQGYSLAGSGGMAWREKGGRAASTILVKELTVGYKKHLLALQSPARFLVQGNEVAVDHDLVLAGKDLTIAIQGKLSTGAADLKIKVDSGPGGAALIAEYLPRRVNFQQAKARIDFLGPLTSPSFTAAGAVRGLAGEDAAIALDCTYDFSYAENRLKIAGVSFSQKGRDLVRLQGNIPVAFKDGAISLPEAEGLNLRAAINLEEPWVLAQLVPGVIQESGPIRAEISLDGSWRAPAGHITVKAQHLVPAGFSAWLPSRPLSIDADFQLAKDLVLAERLFLHSELLSLDAHGALPGEIFSRKAWQDLRNLDGKLDLAGTFTLHDLGWFAKQYPEVRGASGILAGEFLVRGTPQKPVIRAEFIMKEGGLRHSMNIPAIKNIEAAASLDNQTFKLNSFRGLVGGAPVHGQGMAARTPDGAISGNLTLAGSDLLLYRAEGIKVRADAGLDLSYAAGQGRIVGKIELTDTKISKNIGLLSSLFAGLQGLGADGRPEMISFQDEPLHSTGFDVAVTAKEEIVVTSNLFKGRFRPELKIGGTGELPIVTGKIYVNEVTIFLPAGKLVVNSGIIHFLELYPDRPRLELTGSARIGGYDISVMVQGPYDEPIINLSSMPPLPREDLLYLLLTGRPPSGGAGRQDRTANMSALVVYVGKEVFREWFGSDDLAAQDYFLDRLQLDIGKNITKKGDETIEAKFTLGENILRLQDEVFLTAERDVWDNYNAGIRLVFRFQ
ncbi:MAG: translocation/assembly module TamB domain-containing protein [Desulfobulbaceae bacterium]|nr:translocation/assembly module TamB domain-containing protein [Desulfobulbaceae bacterium]HIJ77917.1 hypothetical protein [Deltaproteobacteria bacterium]